MLSKLLTYKDTQVVLILVEPDYADLVKVSEEFDTEIEETVQAVEYRRSVAENAKIEMEYNSKFVDEADDWQEWRALQAYISDRRVVCPIWPDVRPYDEWDTRVHDTSIIVGWNEGFENCVIADSTSVPVRDYIAPACIGRMEMNEDDPICGHTASISIKMKHDMIIGTSSYFTVSSETLLLVQVVDGQIVERVANYPVTTTGTVIIDSTTTKDGYGSIRNTSSSSSTSASGSTSVAASLTLDGDFTIEGWWMPLINSTRMTWLSAYPATAVWQFQNWNNGQYPDIDFNGSIVFAASEEATAGNWYYVAIVRSGSTVSLFINGHLSSEYTFSGSLSFSGIMIGDGPNFDNDVSPCCWENIMISSGARYTANFEPPIR